MSEINSTLSDSEAVQLRELIGCVQDPENFTEDNIIGSFYEAIDHFFNVKNDKTQIVINYLKGLKVSIDFLAGELQVFDTNSNTASLLKLANANTNQVFQNELTVIKRGAIARFKEALETYFILPPAAESTNIFTGTSQEHYTCQINTPLNLTDPESLYKNPLLARTRIINFIQGEELIDILVDYLVTLDSSDAFSSDALNSQVIFSSLDVIISAKLEIPNDKAIKTTTLALVTVRRLPDIDKLRLVTKVIAQYPDKFAKLNLAGELTPTITPA